MSVTLFMERYRMVRIGLGKRGLTPAKLSAAAESGDVSVPGFAMARIGLSVILALGLASTAHSAVWYVDKDNDSGTKDGLTWLTAYTTVHEGLDAADAGDDVWVAEGVYAEIRDNETGSVLMKEDVDLFGGFSGPGSSLKNRNWETHTTTIDGSTARDGEPAYHVLTGINGATLDGFVVTGGNANVGRVDADGGGLICIGVSLTIRNCRFVNNYASDQGGAIYSKNSSLVIADCVFLENADGGGGGAVFAAMTAT
jgi:predicted outer membrane repeat protein